jgi:hypothetical protein
VDESSCAGSPPGEIGPPQFPSVRTRRPGAWCGVLLAATRPALRGRRPKGRVALPRPALESGRRTGWPRWPSASRLVLVVSRGFEDACRAAGTRLPASKKPGEPAGRCSSVTARSAYMGHSSCGNRARCVRTGIFEWRGLCRLPPPLLELMSEECARYA